MSKIKNFIGQRSKLLFISFILSLILFILIIPEFIHYSEFINKIINPSDINLAETTLAEFISASHAAEAIEEFNLIFSCIFVFILLFNLVGYVYKKTEFIFISIGLSVIVTCISVYVTNTIFLALIGTATALNIVGYLEQNKINKKVN